MHGFTVAALLAAGFDLASLVRDAGFSLDSLMAGGVAAKDLRCYFPCRAFKQAGLTVQQMLASGFSKQDVKDAGFSGLALRGAGFSFRELYDLGCSLSLLRTLGCAASEMLSITGDAGVLRSEAHYNLEELAAIGIHPTAPAKKPPAKKRRH